MNRNALLMLASGLLAAVAFFLPLGFLPSLSLLDEVRLTMTTPFPFSTGWQSYFLEGVDFLFEPAGAVLLIIGGLLAHRFRGAGFVLGVIGAVLSLALMLWLFTRILASSYPFELNRLRDVIQPFGIGWWLAVIGSALGLLGALLGWRRLLTQQGILPGRRGFRFSPWALLVLAGGLLLVIGFFFTPFYLGSLGITFFDLLRLPPYPFVLWPDLLAMVLLLLCALVAFTGRKGAYLGGLIGGLIGTAFLCLYTGFILYTTIAQPELHLGVGYWLTAAGSVLGFLGALLGLFERPAALAPLQVQATSSPA